MTTLVAERTSTAVPPLRSNRRFTTADQWLHSLGDVPPSRILFDPLPGTATEADLLDCVDGRGRLCELVDGTLVEKAMGYDQGRLAARLIIFLGPHVEANRLGIVTTSDAMLRMAAGNVRMPDVTFTAVADLPGGVQPPGAVVRMPATLAVEVISPGNTADEMLQKRREYFDSGSRLVWFIYPLTRTVEVFASASETPDKTLLEADSLDGGVVVPGFTLPVATLFHNPFAPR